MYHIYLHNNKVNNKKYIGITKQQPEERWGKNGNNYKSSPHFYSAIQKYGWDNFEHIVLLGNITKEEACLLEQELIKNYNSTDRNFGYNSTTGGETFEMSEESRIKKSESMMGNKNGLGKPCSKEKAKRISDAQKGRKLSEEHKQKLSQSASKRHTPCSDEKKEKLRISHPDMKPVICSETNTIYRSVQECGRQLHLHPTNIVKACKGKIHTTGGFHFKYYDDTINA